MKVSKKKIPCTKYFDLFPPSIQHHKLRLTNCSPTSTTHCTRGDADKSLARPTSRRRRTESKVSLERGSVHVSICKSFHVTEAERKHFRRRALFQQHGDASYNKVFFCKAKRRRKFAPFLLKHYGDMHHRMPPSKSGWSKLKLMIFPSALRLVLDDTKQ